MSYLWVCIRTVESPSHSGMVEYVESGVTDVLCQGKCADVSQEVLNQSVSHL